MKKLLLVCAAVVALGFAIPSHAESVCADAGATNPAQSYTTWATGYRLPTVVTPTVCVPVP